jgi:hypothetical protein
MGLSRPRWYRYQVVIVGQESGNRTALPWLRFRHAVDADRWCDRMNIAHGDHGPWPLTKYVYEEIPR